LRLESRISLSLLVFATGTKEWLIFQLIAFGKENKMYDIFSGIPCNDYNLIVSRTRSPRSGVKSPLKINISKTEHIDFGKKRS